MADPSDSWVYRDIGATHKVHHAQGEGSKKVTACDGEGLGSP